MKDIGSLGRALAHSDNTWLRSPPKTSSKYSEAGSWSWTVWALELRPSARLSPASRETARWRLWGVSTGAGVELESPYTERYKRYILGWVCAGAGVDCECGGQQNVKVTCLINILSGLGGWQTCNIGIDRGVLLVNMNANRRMFISLQIWLNSNWQKSEPS